MRIVEYARAKINWALRIVGRREDGFHELDMLMQSLELCDELALENARFLSLSVDGAKLPVGEKNLVVRAANALNDFTGQRNGARIRLTKRIPMRAGLGGGSADCAAALIGLNRLWNLHLPRPRLMEIGAALGADVPFCLMGGMARAEGVGERLTPMEGAPRIPLALARVGDGLSTPAVYARYDEFPRENPPADIPRLAKALAEGDLAQADLLSVNSLEAPAIELMPEIGDVMRAMRDFGARAVRMTGSGSTVFGAFDSEEAARAAAEAIPGGIFTRTAGGAQPIPS